MIKKEYTESFLICIAEEESLYWLYKNEVENQFISLLDLKKIIYYLINKGIMELNSYEEDEYAAESNFKEILENSKNWIDKNQKYNTNLTKNGFDYFLNKKYCEEIDEGAFPDFKLIKPLENRKP